MNPAIIIIGAIEQLIVWTVILPQTGWWFAFFGIAAVWNIISNLGSVGSGEAKYEKDYYDDYRSSSYEEEDKFDTNINKEKSFSTSPVTTSSNYEYEASNNPETNEELKILTKTKTEVSRKSLPNENSNVLRSKGFKVIKKLKD